jgi:hydrogenase nickel incorporation protein HypB
MVEVDVAVGVLDANDREAAANRSRFRASGAYVLNLMSGPGAGKTTLLEATADRLAGRVRLGIIAGDLQTDRDAARLARHGIPVLQVNTGVSCHLDARLLAGALDRLPLDELELLIIENVGNLVCPAEFDLGEDDKAMVLSVTEGADKPGKYPRMFAESRLMVVGKSDLLPYVDFDVHAAVADARALNAELEVIRLSARTGEGVDRWIDWLLERVAERAAWRAGSAWPAGA